jgi:hypothetical protein
MAHTSNPRIGITSKPVRVAQVLKAVYSWLDSAARSHRREWEQSLLIRRSLARPDRVLRMLQGFEARLK